MIQMKRDAGDVWGSSPFNGACTIRRGVIVLQMPLPSTIAAMGDTMRRHTAAACVSGLKKMMHNPNATGSDIASAVAGSHWSMGSVDNCSIPKEFLTVATAVKQSNKKT